MIDKIVEKVIYAKDIYTNINLTDQIPINVETLDIFDKVLLYLACEKLSETFELLEELLDFFLRNIQNILQWSHWKDVKILYIKQYYTIN